MALLVYTAIASLDGYIVDAEGRFDWAEPDAEVHAFVNQLERPVGTYLYGRRLYETMVAWEDPAMAAADQPAPVREFAAIWRAADKIVFSRTMERPASERTRVERTFDAAAVRRLKETAVHDLGIGGAELGAEAFRAGLVDECRLFLAPAIVGGGTRALPDGVRLDLELLDERRFAGGFVFLRHRVRA